MNSCYKKTSGSEVNESRTRGVGSRLTFNIQHGPRSETNCLEGETGFRSESSGV